MIWFRETRSNSLKYASGGGEFIPILLRVLLSVVFRIFANTLLLSVNANAIRRVANRKVKSIVGQFSHHVHAITVHKLNAAQFFNVYHFTIS